MMHPYRDWIHHIPLSEDKKTTYSQFGGVPNLSQEDWKYNDFNECLNTPCYLLKPILQVNSPHTVRVLTKPLQFQNLPQHPFAYLNTLYANEAISLEISSQHQSDLPIQIQLKDDQKESALHFQLSIHVKKGAKAHLDMSYLCQHSGFLNTLVLIDIEPEASLFLYRYSSSQKIGIDQIHVHNQGIFNAVSFIDSPVLYRQEFHVHLHHPQATSELSGLALLGQEQEVNHHIHMKHHQGNTTGSQLFKHVLFDHSKSEFSGLITVCPQAHGVQSYQLNQNLLLSDHSRALSRPQLKIDADDVQCSHGCTVGQLDEQALFYLRTRGLSLNAAKKCMMQGFVCEVIQKVGVSSIRNKWLEKANAFLTLYE